MNHRLTEADRARLATAFHEAGHAVAAVALGGRIDFATIDEHPRTEFDTLPAGTDAAITYAGPWAEARWLARRHPSPAEIRRVLTANASDDRALCAAGGFHTGAVVVPLLERCWPAVNAVTARLYFDGRIDHATVCAALGLSDDGGPRSVELLMIQSGSAPNAFRVIPSK